MRVSHHRTHHISNLWLCLILLQRTLVLVSSKIIISQPAASTTWSPGESYDIIISSDSQDPAVQTWQVDLVIIGGECDGICLHDGVVKEISQGHSLQSPLRFKVPTNLVQYGKGFQVQLSNAGSAPVYHSETFTIEKADKGPAGTATATTTATASGAAEGAQATTTAHNENAASYVLPAALVTAFSCLFAFMLI
ncbi:hypothetical protein BG015_012005 [Linnemannia schmuckeri]|uniref:Uncharacterized protein n=1 Tax=Linnemannia schmuckeri TaxID=64567 RepID=A0A9P5RRR6_9FUNG|nr:hypothetical protein BG015_012005 [Linnemannia schmuckeri]